MKNKRTTTFFILITIAALTPLRADCLFPQEPDFKSFFSYLSKQVSSGRDSARHVSAGEGLSKKGYWEEADSLWDYARNYFEERLPDSIICQQVAIDPNRFLSVRKRFLKMSFLFYFTTDNVGGREGKVKIDFQYGWETKTFSSYTHSNYFWIPDCKTYPDSCRFLVANFTTAYAVAVEEQFIERRGRDTQGNTKAKPFHYGVTRWVDDDCSVQTLYINMFTAKTHKSDVFKAYGCQTLEDKIKASDVVLEGQIRSKPIGVSFLGKLYTKVEVEVHTIFKEELTDRIITVYTYGGSIGEQAISSSHGSIYLGKEGDSYVFFLNKGNKYLIAEENQNLANLDIFTPHFVTAQPFALYSFGDPNSFHLQIERNLFQKLEEITGRPRNIISRPATRNEKVLTWLVKEKMNIPDRKNGIAFFSKVYIKERKENVLPITVFVGGANRHAYLDSWKLKVTYNEAAFGPHLLSRGQLGYKILRRDVSGGGGYWGREFQVSEEYTVSFEELDSNSFIINWQRNKKAKDYFQTIPLGLKKHLSAVQLVDLIFPVLDENEKANISITPVGKTEFIDLKTSASYPFDYQYSSAPLEWEVNKYYPAKIINFSPKQAAIGDTITINGKYLEWKKVGIYGKSNKGRTFLCSVEKEFIITQKDDLIQFIIPPILGKPNWQNHDREEWFQPTTKYIVLSGEFPISTSSSSEEDLEIIDD